MNSRNDVDQNVISKAYYLKKDSQLHDINSEMETIIQSVNSPLNKCESLQIIDSNSKQDSNDNDTHFQSSAEKT